MDNQWAGNINRVKEVLEKHKALKAVLRTSVRKKVLNISIDEMEKYNYYRFDEEGLLINLDGPNSDGHYDVEGHSNTDVNGHYTLSLFNIKDCWTYLRGIYAELFKMKIEFEFITLSPKRIQWIWVIDSLKSTKADMVYRKCNRDLGKYEEEEKKITYHEVVEEIEKDGCIKISDSMWVQERDPTCIIVDETKYTFDMKDGWSNLYISLIIQTWINILFEEKELRVIKDLHQE